jgi:hypothetical protein
MSASTKRPSQWMIGFGLSQALALISVCSCANPTIYGEALGDSVDDIGIFVSDVSTDPGKESAGCSLSTGMDTLPACCDLAPARCLPQDLIPEGLQGELAECLQGGSCVPDTVLMSMKEHGTYTPRTCTSIGNAPGGCVSVCVPRVGALMAVLPQDVCTETERCTPCIDPFTNEETGVCSGAVECPDADSEPPDADPGCPDMGNILSLPTCCDAGPARCLSMDIVPPGLQSQVATCDDGSACVPEEVLLSLDQKAGYSPMPCASLGGADGRCVSTCIPRVAQYASFLPQDVCASHERCTPCIDPLTNEDTGICGAPIQCDGLADKASPAPPAEPVDPCENPPTQPIPVPPGLAPCCAGAHCLPKVAVPEENHAMLAGCDNGTGLCVPDSMIATGGLIPPATCTSVSGTEGRCLSTCIPAVAEKEGYLPQDICALDERCTPCCDPFTGESTGACDQRCDDGPPEGECGAPIFPECCGGTAHCVDTSLVPTEKQKNVKKCKGDHKDKVCVPDEMQDPNFKGSPCMAYPVFGDPYVGVCLSDCLKIPFKITMVQANCNNGYICVKCFGPFGGPTGAPGCPG